MSHEPKNVGEPTYREAMIMLVAVAAGCALLLLGSMWLIEVRY